MISYDNSLVRRQDRLLDSCRAMELLQGGEYGFLAMATAEGGYGVPVNYVVEKNLLYIHGAPQGRKLEALAHDNRVTFTIVGKSELVPEQFTTAYESIVVEGRASHVDDEDVKRHALELFVVKYAPEHIIEGREAIEMSAQRTAVIVIKIERVSGKTKIIR